MGLMLHLRGHLLGGRKAVELTARVAVTAPAKHHFIV